MGAVAGSPAIAATIVVDTTADTVAVDPATSAKDASGAISLRSAIMAANAQSGPDTIELQPSAAYLLTRGPSDSGLDSLDASTGDLDFTDETTLIGNGAVVDANGIDRAFSIGNASTTDFVVVMNDLTVTGGAPTGFLSPGGGLNVRAATLKMVNCYISSNTTVEPGSTDNGGGIAANGVLFPAPVRATLTLVNCTLVKNTANNGGGLVAGDCVLTLDHCIVMDNTAKGTDAGVGGGGLFLTGNATEAQILNGSRIASNRGASDGGGIAVFSAALDLEDSTVAGNTASGYGGGIFSSPVSPGKLMLRRVTLSGNTADQDANGSGDGGGLYTAGPADLQNVTVSGNLAPNGGGIAGAGPVSLAFSPVAFNQAVSGGGLVPSGTYSATGSIIAMNGALAGPDVIGTLDSQGYNLIGAMNDAAVTGNLTGCLLGVNPRIDALADNGGPTLTPALRPDSPAIDAGPPTGAPETDQRGVPRPQDGNGDGNALPDMGAFEYQRAYSLGEAARALRIAGGLMAASPSDVDRLDIANLDNLITVADAARLARKAAGIEPNP
jgi:hypothetical protein